MWRISFSALLLAAFAVHAQPWPAVATYEGPDREAKLVEGAKKEGMLLLYTTTPVESLRQLTEPFEKRYGVKVDVWRARSEAILPRVINEARGGKPVVDVIDSIAPPMEALHREGLLQEVHSPQHGALQPGAVPAHREWASTLQYVFV